MRYFPPRFGSRNYMILLLKTFSEPSYYRCKSYILLLIAKRHLVILYTRYANSVLASLEPRRSTRKKCYFTYIVHIHDDIVGFYRTKYKVRQNGHCQNEICAKTNHFSKRIEVRLYVCHHKNRSVSGKKRLLTQFTMTTDIK